jgi:hypothetical protein
MIFRLLTFLFAAAAPSAFAWGSEGHRAIGAMADTLIRGTPAAQHVHELLGSETLSEASVWADVVKGRGPEQTDEMIQFKTANPNHSSSHYTDIPFEETSYHDDSAGATNIDVVHAIPACILILQGKPDEQKVFKDASPRVALRLLAHFIEDIHQPLHVGAGYLDKTNYVDPNNFHGSFHDDLGGNELLFGTNQLHSYWDTTVVREDMALAHVETAREFADYLLAQRPVPDWKTSGPFMDWDRAWAGESIVLSAHVHDVPVLDEDDKNINFRTGKPRPRWHIQNLSPDYIAWSEKAAGEQMIKAGHRLAATLEALWPNP